jgi:hypothetical protein
LSLPDSQYVSGDFFGGTIDEFENGKIKSKEEVTYMIINKNKNK